MPKEVVVNAWCDPCYRGGERSPGEEVTVALGDVARMKPQVMLLCERHRKEFYEPMRELVEEFGATPGSEPKAASRRSAAGGQPSLLGLTDGERIQCPACEATPKNLDTLQGHLRNQHDTTIWEFWPGDTPILDVAGNEVPGKPRTSAPPAKLEWPCKLCDTVYVYPKHQRPKQALSVHLSQAHGKKYADVFPEE